MMQENIDAQGLYDIYQTVHVPFWQQAWFQTIIYAASITLIFSLVSFLVYLIYKRRKKSLWDQAIRDISQLAINNTQNPKEYYRVLSLRLKKYLIERYTLAQSGITDLELAKDLSEFIPSGHVRDHMQQLMQEITHIKFAHTSADLLKFIQLKEKSIALIRYTIPHEKNS